MSAKNIFLKMIVPLLVIALGVGIMMIMTRSRTGPVKEERTFPGVLVKVMEVKKEDTEVSVRGTGTVKTSQEVTVSSQVSGRITYVAPRMVAGGFFSKGDILLRIEESDYRLALRQAVALRARSEYDLATIESQALVARTEWERIYNDKEATPNPLVLFEPQLKNAEAALDSASAAVEQAKLNLERTVIRAPFNCRVRSEDVDPGRYVKSGDRLGIIAGTDSAEIIVPLSMNDLRWLEIPRTGKGEKGSPVTVYVNTGASLYEWAGHLVRSTGEVDPKSRMMQVVVEVTDPYGLKGKKEGTGADLVTGTFVDVEIRGKKLRDVFIIPRPAIRDDSTVWIMDGENKLRIKKVIILRAEKEEVIISGGLKDRDMLILTNISGAADGMKLRVAGAGE